MGRSMHRFGRRTTAAVALAALTWGQVAPAQLLRARYSTCDSPATVRGASWSCGCGSWGCEVSCSRAVVVSCQPCLPVAMTNCGGWMSGCDALPGDASGAACNACDGSPAPVADAGWGCAACQVEPGGADPAPPTVAPPAAESAPAEAPPMEAPAAVTPEAAAPPVLVEEDAEDPLFKDLFPPAPTPQEAPAGDLSTDPPLLEEEAPAAESTPDEPMTDAFAPDEGVADEPTPDDLRFDDPLPEDSLPAVPATEPAAPEESLFDEPMLDEPAAPGADEADPLFDESLFDAPAAPEADAVPDDAVPGGENGLFNDDDRSALSPPAEDGLEGLFDAPGDDLLPSDAPAATEIAPEPADAAPADAAPADAAPADEAPADEAPADEEDALDLDDLFGSRGPAARTWTDNTGGFRVDAVLQEIGAQHVRLLKANGKFCTVPFHRLSEADFAFVQLQARHLGHPAPVRVATR